MCGRARRLAPARWQPVRAATCRHACCSRAQRGVHRVRSVARNGGLLLADDCGLRPCVRGRQRLRVEPGLFAGPLMRATRHRHVLLTDSERCWDNPRWLAPGWLAPSTRRGRATSDRHDPDHRRCVGRCEPGDGLRQRNLPVPGSGQYRDHADRDRPRQQHVRDVDDTAMQWSGPCVSLRAGNIRDGRDHVRPQRLSRCHQPSRFDHTCAEKRDRECRCKFGLRQVTSVHRC
jgi:hypothetical protein